MDEIATGRIYKLFVGVNLATYYYLGHVNKDINAKIVDIIYDVNYFIENGVTKHIVVVEDLSSQEKWVWATPVGLPFLVQYDRPNGNPQNLI